MATNNKVFYEVNPRFFKDTTGNGIGDLQGLIQKIDYFSFLGINTIILQDVLLIESKEKSLKYFVKEVNPQIGNNKLLHEFILLAQKKKIKVLLELPWLKSIQKDPQNFLKKKLHLVLPDFSEFISYWNNYNVGGFVITNFENIEKKWFQKTIDNSIISTLHDFYHKSKEVDSELLIIGRSSKLKIIHAKKHVEGTNQIFDYFLSENLTINSISKEHGIHIWNKLNLNILVKNLKQIACQPNFIVAFDTKHFGRVISRWIDNENYWAEAAKSLVMLLMIGKASPLIYYGNEIGLTNIGLKSLNDFPNIHLVKKEKAFKELSITDEELLKAYKFQHPINANPLMAWNSSTNGGFSQGPKMIVPSSSNFKEINVLNQFHDSFSVLNFSKEIIIISNILKNTPLFQKGIYKITLVMKNVIKITWKLNDKKLVAFFNFSNKNKELKWNSFSKKHIIISNCTAERKEDVVSKLRPFETIIFKNFANSTLDSIRKKDLNKHKNIFNHSESTKNNSKFQKNISS